MSPPITAPSAYVTLDPSEKASSVRQLRSPEWRSVGSAPTHAWYGPLAIAHAQATSTNDGLRSS
eukprot:4785843-Prymnesium_polylepis.2